MVKSVERNVPSAGPHRCQGTGIKFFLKCDFGFAVLNLLLGFKCMK